MLSRSIAALLCFWVLATASQSEAAILADAQSDVDSILGPHNTHRALHSAPALKWSTSLANSAATWANGCKYAHSTAAQRNNAGENLSVFLVGSFPYYVNTTFLKLSYKKINQFAVLPNIAGLFCVSYLRGVNSRLVRRSGGLQLQ